MWTNSKTKLLSLNAAVATGAGAVLDCGTKTVKSVRYYLKAASITTGGTVRIQVSNDNSTWYDVQLGPVTTAGAQVPSLAIAATGNVSGQVSGPGRYWRANVTARTDGTYSCDLEAELAF